MDIIARYHSVPHSFVPLNTAQARTVPDVEGKELEGQRFLKISLLVEVSDPNGVEKGTRTSTNQCSEEFGHLGVALPEGVG